MKVLKVIGTIVVAILLVIVLAIYLLPTTAHMKRSIIVDTDADPVYRELISFRNFNTWSPWAEKDPTATYIYEGPEFGVGARVLWKSEDPDLGNGSMEIVEAIPNKQVTSVLRFDEYESTPYGTFSLEPLSGGKTKVTWSYDEYDVHGFAKIFMLGIDGFLGRDWELALERLKERVESAPDFTTEVSLEEVSATWIIGVQDTSLNDPAMISVKMAQQFGDLMSFFAEREIEPAGYPITIYTTQDAYALSFICGIPLPVEVDSVEGFSTYETYEGLTIRSLYQGDYSGLEIAHEEIKEFAAFYHYEIIGNPWEEYVTDPSLEPDPQDWVTCVYYPVR